MHLISCRGGEAFAVTEAEEGVAGFEWSPSGDRLMLLVQEPESEDAKARVELYGDFSFDDETGRNSHLWVVEIDADGETSEPERLTEGEFHVAGFEWSPDGASVAYVRQPDSSPLSLLDTPP